ncbi:MAG TPA: ABC transporter ATP-binding protein [Steroidobacteraceae bacterium]|nr:ABC transporter ATP-binding protein [Steroidobacteraceae bacterium]
MIVQLEHLHCSYGRTEALRGLSLAVPEGSTYALIGANGAGKTTTLKVLMNMLVPSHGTATVLGVDSRRLAPRELAQIGYVSENQVLPGGLRVGEFLKFLRPFYGSWDIELERSILQRLALPTEQRIRDLSHGMRLKMALAGALPFRPRLLVLDEPFSGLDPLVRDEFMDQLLHHAGEMTILISSHELAEIENVTTHVGFIQAGKVLFEESMEELTGRSRAVRITLRRAAVQPAQLPPGWMQVSADGNVLSFIHTRFSADSLAAQIDSILPGVTHVDVQPLPLRAIFTTLARAARER